MLPILSNLTPKLIPSKPKSLTRGPSEPDKGVKPCARLPRQFLTLAFALGASSIALAQSPIPTAQGQVDVSGTYAVVAGDTLYGIATRYGMTITQMTNANALGPSPTLYVGQRLVIPGVAPHAAATLATTTAVGASNATYTVKPGDTLFSIARSQAVSVDQLTSLNQLSNPTQIFVGQVLQLGGPLPLEFASNSGSAVTHRVEAGETLFSIARAHGISISELSNLNGLSDPGQIFVGQVLRLPESGLTPIGNPNNGPFPNPIETTTVPGTGEVRKVSAPTAATDTTAAPSSQITEARVSTSAATPLMLPSPPPRRGSKFHWPARGKVTERFGDQSNGQTSDGIEIEVASGANVLAAEDGVVAFAGTGVSGQGYLVLIKHADNYYTAYSQNSAVTVRRGDVVRRGDLIARAGTAVVGVKGRLHFEVRYQETPVNPIAYMVN